LRLFPEKPITFSCRCDHEKMKQVLYTLGQADAEQLLEEQEKIAVTCDFCNKQHVFDSIDIALLFRTPPHS
jgi:molecular chaperone Hsp33